MQKNRRNVQPVGKTGYTNSNHKRGYLRLATEWVDNSKKPYALRKIYHDLGIGGTGFLGLFGKVKQ